MSAKTTTTNITINLISFDGRLILSGSSLSIPACAVWIIDNHVLLILYTKVLIGFCVDPGVMKLTREHRMRGVRPSTLLGRILPPKRIVEQNA